MTLAPIPVHRRVRLWAGPAVVLALALAVVVLALVFRNDVVGGSSSSATVHGSGVAAAQVRKLPPFSGVELSGSNTVTIHVGGDRSVVVHADENLLGHVTTSIEGRSLVIGNTPGSISTESPMRVDVTVPSLEAVDLSGNGVISATGVSASVFRVTLSGSGLVHATGKASRLDVRLAGSGDAQLQEVVATDVRAVVEGSGRILVHPTTSLDAAVPGSGAIVYVGHPAHTTTSVTGSGAVTHG